MFSFANKTVIKWRLVVRASKMRPIRSEKQPTAIEKIALERQAMRLCLFLLQLD